MKNKQQTSDLLEKKIREKAQEIMNFLRKMDMRLLSHSMRETMIKIYIRLSELARGVKL